MSIPLPPLQSFEQYAGQHKELRARDLEVARVALEAAAELADAMDYGLGDLPKAIRALEFKHE